MLDELKSYLSDNGFENIYIDMLPAPENCSSAVGLFEWNNPRSELGETTHYIQIQVRRSSYDEARSDCELVLLFLDSGMDETLIRLSESVSCISRPRRGPLLLERGAGYTTFYAELAIWTNE